LASDGEDVSTAELLCRIGAALGKPAKLLPVPVGVLRLGAAALGKADVAQRLLGSLQVDISKNRQLLGWLPPMTLDEGLRRVVAEF
jgi:nucleoside-diphosphate-sugar epimerase